MVGNRVICDKRFGLFLREIGELSGAIGPVPSAMAL
jgi:hypothetical protein